jgi:NitT/TauT family transport system substrate-binding protein
MTQIDRRTLLKTLGAAAAVGAVGGGYALSKGAFGSAASPVASPGSLGALNVGYLPITDASPLLIADAEGIYNKNGFLANKPTVFTAWPALTEAFLSKQVDLVHMLMPLALQVKFAQKQDIKIVAWNHTDGSALTVAQNINAVTDLAGQNVAIPGEFSLHNIVIQQVLRANGLTPIFDGEAKAADKTVKLVILPPAEMPPALAGKAIAGYIVADPFNALAEVKGIGKILRFTGEVWKEHACCVTVVRGELVKDNPEAAQALVTSIAEAQLLIRADRAAAATTLAQGYLPQGPEAITKALTSYNSADYPQAITHPEWKSERINFQPYPFPSYTEELVNQLKQTQFSDAAKVGWLETADSAAIHGEVVAAGLAEQAITNVGGLGKFELASLERKELIAP